MSPTEVERIAVLEAKVDDIGVKVNDLHDDMVARRTRGALFNCAFRYGVWLFAAFVGVFSSSKQNAINAWLGMTP